MTRSALRVTPPAKVNLHLEILGRRPDGYHEVRTLLQSIDLRDELVAKATSEDGPRLTVKPVGAAPEDGRNLVIRAAELLRARAGRPLGASLRLSKRIPAGGGLGGGSADAAAALVLLNRLWHLDLAPHTLAELAAELGADVPFFLHGGLAVGVGRGDEVYPLPDLPTLPVVVVVPGVEVPTAEVYRRLEVPATWARASVEVSGFVSGLLPGPPWPHLRNDLEAVVVAGWTPVAAALAAVRGLAGRRTAVTGSGSAVYAVMDTTVDAERAAEDLTARGWRVEVASTLSRARARLTVDTVPTEDLE